MENQKELLLQKLREIEEQAQTLTLALPTGLPLHRTRQIQSLAAHLALQVELENAGGHLRDAANDNQRAQTGSPA